MYLEKLDIQGFKSFANKTELKFELKSRASRITAIVGPNGCGKSNVADAIRWVMGEQSMKLLRGKRYEDVIFSGSDKKARLGMAEVSITLNNEDKTAPIDYSQVVLTRRLYRSGESEYLINNNKIRLYDIQLLLAKARFGQRTYSVIGQGMIENILITSPSERKIFFEEAAGVREFQIKREQSLNKLQSTLENLIQAEALMEEIKPRLQYLARQVNRLERRQEVETKLSALQLDHYSLLMGDFESQKKILEEKLRRIKIEEDRKKSELSLIQEKFKQIEHEEKRSTVFDALQNQYEKLLEKKNALREKELKIQSSIELKKRLAQKIPTIKPLSEIISDIEKLLLQQEKLFQDIFQIETLDELSKIQEKTQQHQKNFSRYIQELKNPSKPSEAESADSALLQQLEEIKKEIASLSENIQTLQQKMRQFYEEEEKSRGSLFSLQRELQKKQMEVNAAVSEVNELNIELAKITTRKEDLEREIRDENLSLEKIQHHRVSGDFDAHLAEEQIKRYQHQLELIGGIDEETLKEYEETKKRYDGILAQVEDLKKASADLEKIIEELNENIKKIFHASFAAIDEHFQKYFRILFRGGNASLEIQKEDEMINPENSPETKEVQPEQTQSSNNEEISPVEREKNPLERILMAQKDHIAGVEIYATPPGKRIKNIHMLSGGERALTAIALICAIISVNPTPFVVLDEVDAALDEANSDRLANIIQELSQKTQFITITHNRSTMHNAGILYGVTMGEDGVSHIVSMRLGD